MAKEALRHVCVSVCQRERVCLHNTHMLVVVCGCVWGVTELADIKATYHALPSGWVKKGDTKG